LHVHGRGARTDASARSLAVLSTQVSPVGLRLRLEVPRPDAGFNSWLAPRLTCGSMLEVSCGAFAAGEEQLVSFAQRRWRFEPLLCRLRLRH
jgi:hypothetical protein